METTATTADAARGWLDFHRAVEPQAGLASDRNRKPVLDTSAT